MLRLGSTNVLEYKNGENWETLITPNDRMIGDRPYNLDVSDSSLDGITIGVSTKVDDPSADVASYTTSNGTAAGQSGAKIVMQVPKAQLGSTVYHVKIAVGPSLELVVDLPLELGRLRLTSQNQQMLPLTQSPCISIQ